MDFEFEDFLSTFIDLLLYILSLELGLGSIMNINGLVEIRLIQLLKVLQDGLLYFDIGDSIEFFLTKRSFDDDLFEFLFRVDYLFGFEGVAC